MKRQLYLSIFMPHRLMAWLRRLTGYRHAMTGAVTLIVICLLCAGCRTIKESTTETTDTKDSIRTEYIEKIIKDTVIVTVEVPAETKERETRDTVSTLATSFATRTASIRWKDGEPLLYHRLENIPQEIQKPVETESKETEKTVYKTRYVTRYKTVVKEKQLSAWQKFMIKVGYVGLGIVTVLIIFIGFRFYVGKSQRR